MYHFILVKNNIPERIYNMEFTILARIRVALAIAVGGALLALVGWQFVAPSMPQGPVTLFAGDISILDGIIAAALAFAAGFIGYFLTYPYGKQIGVLAVPGGLAVLTFRGGDMTSLMRVNAELSARQAVYATLKWEGLFWLALVAIGFAGVIVAHRIKRPANELINEHIPGASIENKKIRNLIALIATVVASSFLIGILAQDVRMADPTLGSVVGQPGPGQVAFAVFIAFGVSAWAVKYFLNVSFIIPAAAGAILCFISMNFYVNQTVLEYITKNWALAFYPRSICAILPLQMIAFSALGAVAGYWLAIKIKHGPAE
jgi:hypothetical protein